MRPRPSARLDRLVSRRCWPMPVRCMNTMRKRRSRSRQDTFGTDKWEEREPKAVAAFFVDFDKTFAYLKIDFPDALLPLICPTNRLERFHREARRKQHDIGICHSEHGCEVLWYLLAMRETAKQQALLKCSQCRL